MSFVAGVDSSTQSTKVEVRDLDSGARRREVVGAPPGDDSARQRAGPGRLVVGVRACVGRRPVRRRSRRSASPASSTAWSCSTPTVGSSGRPSCGTTPRVAADAGWLLRAAGGAACGLGGGRRQRAGGVVHDHQALVAAPQGAGGVEAPRPRVAAARLADVAAHGRQTGDWSPTGATRRAPGTGRRRRASTGSTCSASSTPIATGRPRCHACWARPRPPANGVSAVVAAGHRRQHGRRARARRSALGDTVVSIGTSGTVVRRVRSPVRRPDRSGRGVRRRDRSLPAARLHAERGQGARRGPRSARRRSRSSSTGWRWRATPVR